MADIGRRAPLAQSAQTDTQAADETRMRRALGLGTGSNAHTPQQRPEQARARHRFVQDGGVPVTVLNAKHEPESAALREKITALQASLENERHAHEAVRRQLKDAADQVTALQTRLVHADLAHNDALQQERALRIAAQEALQQSLAAAAPRRRAPTAPHIPAPEHEALGTEGPAEPAEIKAAAIQAPVVQPAQESGLEHFDTAEAAAPAPVKRGRGRPRSTALPEPKPVRWWTPSYRTKPKS